MTSESYVRELWDAARKLGGKNVNRISFEQAVRPFATVELKASYGFGVYSVGIIADGCFYLHIAYFNDRSEFIKLTEKVNSWISTLKGCAVKNKQSTIFRHSAAGKEQ